MAFLQFGGAARSGSTGGFLPPFPRVLCHHHRHLGNPGNGSAGVGLHLSVLPVQVPVEADGQRHEHDLQVNHVLQVLIVENV